ncbi:ABC transporter substrate-binding protein [Kibdelosporangium philippinense]|uniref:ABC transporter substrate-binding protein n=1 Tax=Kibdelosporangium philippinense TaxID=211113 RepID=A0ABS8Z1V6_9PSEU|nr:ABC transporter substrate-binding protein [Kibdelosporangium philippinense]MCE7001921.1 ABC transporter substrate-binding protein [Kibdelosporangium philippinense]
MKRVALLAMGVLVVGCSTPVAEGGPATAQQTTIDRTVQPLRPSLTVTAAGSTLTLPQAPERIVCLNGLCDDVLTELGIVPAGTSNPTLLGHPALLGERGTAVPVVKGTFGSEDVESVAALRPDLVIGLPGVHDGLRPAIEKFAPLWLVEPTKWQESVESLRAIGALTNRTDAATNAEQRFRDKLASAVATTHQNGQAQRKALLMYGSVDSIGVDTSASLKGNLLGLLFTYPFPAKGTDATTASTYSVEELLAKQPDVVFVYSLLFSSNDRTLSAQLADNPIWKRIPAVQQGHVYETHTKLWGSGRGTRSLSAVIDEAVAKVAAS